jgi:hypothetical protein
MARELPRDSYIKIERSVQGETLSWTNEERGNSWFRLGFIAFVLFWFSAMVANTKDWFGLIFGWIFGIIIGGVLLLLFRELHEKIELRSDELRYQYAKNTMISARQYEISNLQLIQVAENLKLSFDVGAKEIEVGKYLKKSEKEWLYNRLQEWLRLRRT